MTIQLSRDVVVSSHSARLATPFASPWIAAALICVAVGQQAVGHLDCDVSWFTTFAEKYVDGAVPYVDVTDPNPPASFLALVPAVKLARLFHLPVEPVLAALVFVFSLICLAMSATILRFGVRRTREDWGLLLNAAIFLFLVAPELVFAEREHLAVLALAPFYATLAVSGEGGRTPIWLRIIAGIGTGLALCFKPFFILPLALPVLALALRDRAPRLLLTPEIAAAGAVTLAYAAAILVLFPAYVDYALPVIAEIYQPSREDAFNLAFLTLAPVNIILLVALAFVSARGLTHPQARPLFVAPATTVVCAFASLGFLVAFFIQGKGWMNHAYPGVVLALLAWIFFLLDTHPRVRAARDGRAFKLVFLPLLIAAPAMFGAGKLLADEEEQPGLRAEIARVAPPHPRVIALAPQLDYGHPVTRQLGGTWVGRPNAVWLSAFAGHLLRGEQDPVRRARLEDYRNKDMLGFAQDVRAGRPDVIIVADKATRDAGLKQPKVAEAFADFVKSGQAGEIEIWTRRAP
jgi:hypothetical protein